MDDAPGLMFVYNLHGIETYHLVHDPFASDTSYKERTK
jgi:hypothetical protein